MSNEQRGRAFDPDIDDEFEINQELRDLYCNGCSASSM